MRATQEELSHVVFQMETLLYAIEAYRWQSRSNVMNRRKKSGKSIDWLEVLNKKIILSFCKNGKTFIFNDFCNRDIVKPLREIEFNSQYVNGN